MKIQRLYINNFKSLVEFELINPNPFSVFVGPNGAGKSNIFEALEFINITQSTELFSSERYFGGKENILNLNSDNYEINFEVTFSDLASSILKLKFGGDVATQNFNMPDEGKKKFITEAPEQYSEWNQFYNGFSRIFASGKMQPKLNFTDDSRLLINASNLEKVLRRILLDNAVKEEFIEWLQLFVPEFDRIEIVTDEVDGEAKLRIFEKHTRRPLNKALISDGTFNILALLCVVFQSEEPQFLCIEEPENGLNPKVIKALVGFFRDKCAEKGHFIWLNTHSQTLVSQLNEDEIIVVDKVKGVTRAQQYRSLDLQGLPLDEAWLTNTLGGGLPW